MKNIGKKDRLIRFALAILLLAVAYWKSSWLALAGAGFVFFEVAMSWCVLYQILGKNSCPIKKERR